MKRRVQEKDSSDRLSQLEKVEKQGQMIASVEENEIEIWANTIQSLPAQQMQFVLNAAVGTLPHNANLHLWGKETDACPLCGERQTLIHVLNNYKVALELCRYNPRHDSILSILADTITKKLSPSSDLDSDYIQLSPTHYPDRPEARHHLVG